MEFAIPAALCIPLLFVSLHPALLSQPGLLFPRGNEPRLPGLPLEMPRPRWILPDKSPWFQIDRSGMWKKAEWADFPH